MSSKKKFGWLPHSKRTSKQGKIHENLTAFMPCFFIAGQTAASDGANVRLWDFTMRLLNEHLPTLAQQTGSCVGQGAWNAVMYLSAMEIVRLGDNEKLETIFLPYHYGRGRHHAGISGRGDGSTGSGQAEAVVKDGVIAQFEHDDLPEPSGGNSGLTWGGRVEMDWSNGAGIAGRWVREGKKHPIKSTALVVNYEQARDALANGYPVTVASMRGFRMRTQVDKGKHWGVPSGQWAHQMCVPAGTLVRQAGRSTPIEDITVGDMVIGHDGKTHKVTKLWSRPFTGELVELDADELVKPVLLTENHPVITRKFVERVTGSCIGGELGERMWTMAGNVQVGHYLRRIGSEFGEGDIEVTSIRWVPHSAHVYNLEVDGCHSYIAGGIAVHNCFIGVDDDRARPGLYCMNSWGADAHGPPADSAPPGGFWVDADVVTKMLRERDSFAYSQFEGFPEQDVDYLLG